MSKKSKSRKSKSAATNTLEGQADKATKKNVKAPRKKARTSSAGRFLENLSRRKALKILAGVGVAGVGVSTLHAYDKSQRTLHDLTVLGQGQPVVVQIHDPGCPTCRRLKSAVSSAMKSSPQVLYRLADITTAEGKALQTKYAVPHVTLLFFDGAGKHLHTTRGLLTPDQVRNNVDRYLS